MSIIIGLTGKPNIGKSTFFKAATMTDVEIGNYPFTTIKPNYGVAYIQIPCPCINNIKTCSFCKDHIRYIQINLIDIAGIVPDAHLGKGLGNKFLDDLRQADCIIHIIDGSGSTDIEGNAVPIGFHNPIDDIEFLNKELELWIYDLLQKNWSKIIKKIKNEYQSISNVISSQLTGAGVKQIHVEEVLKKIDDKDISKWNTSDILKFAKLLKMESKLMIIVVNKIDIAKDDTINILKSYSKSIFFVSAETELALKLASKNGYIDYRPGSNNFKIINKNMSFQQKEGMNKIQFFLNKYSSTGVQNCLNEIVLNILNMIVVFPVEDESKWSDKNGVILPTAFLMKNGSTCMDLAKKIHTDISSSFLYAIDAKTKKRISEKYILKHMDIIKIVFSHR